MSAIDRGFEPRSGQAKDYNIGCCFFVFLQQYDIFIQNACYILTSKAQATYEVFHINIFLI
jgi:hypothetical protein